MDDLGTSSDLQLFHSLHQAFGDCSERADYNWSLRHFHAPYLFWFSGKVLVLFSLRFSVCGSPKWQRQQYDLYSFSFFFFFSFNITRSSLLARIRWSVCISKSQRIFASHSSGRILVCASGSRIKFYSLAQFPTELLPHPIVSSFILFFVLVCGIRLLCN